MTKLTSKREIRNFTLLFAAMYMVSYITRINFGAIISEMESKTGWSRSLLSLSLTGAFITYGTGQIISGILGDRFSPKKLVLIGLMMTSVINFIIPFCKSPYYMVFFWCINGFAQSFLWPPVAKLMTEYLTEDDYKSVSVKISWGSSFGTMAVYLFSPLIIAVSSWRMVFFASAVAGVLISFLWNKYSCDIEIKKVDKQIKKKDKEKGVSFFSPVIFVIMLAIICQGMLRDGVTTWMPSYISETYNLSNIIAILSGVVLPLFSILCFKLSIAVYTKKLTNPMVCSAAFFLVGAAMAGGLCVITGKNAAMSVVFSAALTGCMHGVNLILISMVPPFFKKTGNVSTASGVLNSCTYIGSALSTYLIAYISEKVGWSFTLYSWFFVALTGGILCLANAKPWTKKFE